MLSILHKQRFLFATGDAQLETCITVSPRWECLATILEQIFLLVKEVAAASAR